MAKRSKAGLFQRLLEAGSKSTSHKGELKSRRATARKQQRLEVAREREAEREEIRRERQKIRDANKLKRKLLAQDRKDEQRRRKEEEREAPHKAMPSAAAIDQAYKSGARSLSEAMEMARRNPSKRNPPGGSKGKFQRCVEAVTKKGGARDPEAVCGAMEKRLRANPGYDVLVNGQYFSYFPTKARADRYARRLEGAGNRGAVEVVKHVEKRAANPADAAMAVSEEFHGRPVKAMIPVQQKRHYHKYLAQLGELRKLIVETRDGKTRVTLSKFGGAMLASNEDRNQLFIVDGDQSVNLQDFGIRNPHEVETLGEVVKIEYFTDKEHLGSEGGEAVYVHKFRATNDNGRHKTVRMARNPDLIYYLRDEHLEFSGGSYEIRAEGIDK
jgi:hypothetical protein